MTYYLAYCQGDILLTTEGNIPSGLEPPVSVQPWCSVPSLNINGDDIPELLLGDKFEDGSTVLYDIYTIHPKTASLIHLASGGERDRFTVSESGTIIENGSNSAFESFTKAYRIKKGKLVET